MHNITSQAPRGLLLVLSAPSGAGKTTLTKELLARDSNIKLSISATTRPPRAGEVHGRDYYFVSPDQFCTMVQQGKMAEYATVHDKSYGTPKADLEQRLSAGQDVLLDIDWQGGYQLRESMGNDVVTLFIIPPSQHELERRLRGRGSDSKDVIQTRLQNAAHEIERGQTYDYLLVNDNLQRCLDDLMSVLRAERLKRQRAHALQIFLTTK